jgi:Fe-S-cluster containining protein
MPAASYGFDCQSCGACCSVSADWPRFSMEDEVQLDSIPSRYIRADEGGMRCDGVRCSALSGEVGKFTACGIYELRPDVCRACVPGGDDCLMAREAHGMPRPISWRQDSGTETVHPPLSLIETPRGDPLVTFNAMKMQAIAEDPSLSIEEKIAKLREIESEARALQRAASESPMNSNDGWDDDLREVRFALDRLGAKEPKKGAASL